MTISFKNGDSISFQEKELDQRTWTIKGHAAAIIKELQNPEGFYKLDDYNSVLLSEIISVTVN